MTCSNLATDNKNINSSRHCCVITVHCLSTIQCITVVNDCHHYHKKEKSKVYVVCSSLRELMKVTQFK